MFTVQFTMAGSVSDFSSTKQKQVKKEIAAAAGVAELTVQMTVKAGSVILTVRIPAMGEPVFTKHLKS